MNTRAVISDRLNGSYIGHYFIGFSCSHQHKYTYKKMDIFLILANEWTDPHGKTTRELLATDAGHMLHPLPTRGRQRLVLSKTLCLSSYYTV